jgi:hypothetical protein
MFNQFEFNTAEFNEGQAGIVFHEYDPGVSFCVSDELGIVGFNITDERAMFLTLTDKAGGNDDC